MPPILLVATAAAAPVEDGRALFLHVWTPDDPMAVEGGDGLGPLYNDTSCVACHSRGGVGGAGSADDNVTLMPHVGVVHRHGLDGNHEPWRQRILTPPMDHACGVCGFHSRFPLQPHERNPTALFGVGQLDAVTEADLLAAVSAGEARGVSGRIARDAGGRAGRFGWRAQTATLAEFVEQACASELGLTTPSRVQTLVPSRQLTPTGLGVVPDPDRPRPALDLDQGQVDALVAFVTALPAPTRSGRDAGARDFDAIGCTACHTPRLGPVEGAYTDLLLHDLGAALADGSHYGPVQTEGPEPGEWRTPPLWGVGRTAPYLHDGRAATLRDAIDAHGGEAAASLVAFRRLPTRRRRDVLAFLEGL